MDNEKLKMEQRKNIVLEKSFGFAVRIVKLSQYLVEKKRERVLAKQVLRAGTSIGANVEEADNASSRADFAHKISISLKEAKETHYWLRLLVETGYLERSMFESIIVDCNELCKLLFAILKTTRLRKASAS